MPRILFFVEEEKNVCFFGRRWGSMKIDVAVVVVVVVVAVLVDVVAVVVVVGGSRGWAMRWWTRNN